MPDSSFTFTDDSSSALGLSHSASYKSSGIARWKAQQDKDTEERLRSLGVACDADGRPQVQHITPDNAGAHDALALLLNAGYHWREALDLLDALSAIGRVAQESQDDEDGPKESDSEVFFEWCMRPPVSPDHKSSRSRTKRRGGAEVPDPAGFQPWGCDAA